MILVDNGSYGTIRMHQERDYPKRITATDLANPDFATLAEAYGGWAETVERTDEFAPALDRAMKRKGIRLIHCKTDIEEISNATTISKLRRVLGRKRDALGSLASPVFGRLKLRRFVSEINHLTAWRLANS